MALTFGDFLAIFTTNDGSGGRAIKATFDTGIDDAANYLTKNDPAGGRAIKVVNVGAPLGPQFWTEAYNAGTQATSSWTAAGAAANINAAIVPKGTGAITASIPDGTTVGGNARGIYAVDLQRQRTASNQVAASENSVICGGYRNRLSPTFTYYGFIGGGNNNNVSDYGIGGAIVAGTSNTITNAEDPAFIGCGQGNTIYGRGNFAVICGGQNNSVGQLNGFVGGGYGNSNVSSSGVICGGNGNSMSSQVGNIGGGFIGGGYQNNGNTGAYGVICGGYQNDIQDTTYASILGGLQARASLYGQTAHASGQFSARGDAQAHELIWRRAVTGTAQTELFLDGASAAAILPGTNAIWQGVIDIAAVCTATGDGTTIVGHVEATSCKVTIKRIGTTTSLVGTVQEIGTTNADGSMATAAITIDNNDTNESLRIRFTPPGTAGSTTVIRVVATFRGLQIQY